MPMRRHCAVLSLLVLAPLAAPAQETCKPVASQAGLALSADGDWLAAAGKQSVQLFNDPPALPAPTFDGGESVAIHAGRMAVGSPGEESAGVVRVYSYDDSHWSAVLPKLENGRPGARFGASVALGEDWLVVGAPEDGAVREGAAYVYSAKTLKLERVLHPADGRLNDRFGASVAVDGNTVVVGAPYADDLKVFYNFGAVYVFDAGSGAQTAKLRADGKLISGDIQFGTSVAIRGGSIVAGAPGYDVDNKESVGAAYLFARGGEGWSKIKDLEPGNPTPGRQLGKSVAIDDELVAIGAPFAGEGAAFLFNRENGEFAGQCSQCGKSDFGQAVALWNHGEVFLSGKNGVAGCFKIPDTPQPHLTCKFEGSPESAPAGSLVTYHLAVTNDGKAAAVNAKVIVTSPATTTCTAVNPCLIKRVGVGETRRRDVTFQLPQGCAAPAEITPAATVDGIACSLDRKTTRVLHEIRGTVEGDGRDVHTGENLVYHLRLVNDSPSLLPDRSGHELDHPLPPGLRLLKEEILTGGGTLSTNPKPSGDPTESLYWDGTLPGCGTVDVRVAARVDARPGAAPCLTAMFTGLDGKIHAATPYCFRVIEGNPGLTPPSGGR
jgi:hypothetical protein